ncbi:hypothetical protein GCM10011584_30920 [Nocardioides phosphati]|uniref:Uncharacterized protein n=1 Tax=Nocardioides phosphati TaxID=1867775 RepID=A0ABQ2NFK5_9ACTN|nr:hypothetical protein [Nocardioides phosphati]GGO93066.1 hypothetical protein GCM10011584_30920 [Nocardioides phosphati]
MSEFAPGVDPTAAVSAPARERVGLGLLAAAGVVVLGVALTVVVWRLGFVASITSFVLAAGAVFAYSKAAGADPRRGLPALVVLIIAGVVAGCLALIGSDAWDAWAEVAGPGSGTSRSHFVTSAMTDSTIIAAYKRDLLFYVGFAVLGAWSTFRRLLAH